MYAVRPQMFPQDDGYRGARTAPNRFCGSSWDVSVRINSRTDTEKTRSTSLGSPGKAPVTGTSKSQRSSAATNGWTGIPLSDGRGVVGPSKVRQGRCGAEGDEEDEEAELLAFQEDAPSIQPGDEHSSSISRFGGASSSRASRRAVSRREPLSAAGS
jgi:hypothetical protein